MPNVDSCVEAFMHRWRCIQKDVFFNVQIASISSSAVRPRLKLSPTAFPHFSPSFCRLHLNSNRLVAINSQWFESLPSLEILMIGENPILGLEDKNFLPLSRLHSLVLAGMGLNSVPSAVFHGLDYLESLSFYDNRLRCVSLLSIVRITRLTFPYWTIFSPAGLFLGTPWVPFPI